MKFYFPFITFILRINFSKKKTAIKFKLISKIIKKKIHNKHKTKNMKIKKKKKNLSSITRISKNENKKKCCDFHDKNSK